jgi:glutathione synthase/RimK-type ligase-like ATP-grasp enzyme
MWVGYLPGVGSSPILFAPNLWCCDCQGDCPVNTLAIHENDSLWAKKWIEYCRENGVSHKIVDCWAPDVIAQLDDCWGLMWHFSQSDPTDMLMARHVFNAAEQMGLVVFPDFKTNWHFDDKLAQKYLFEALRLPAAPMWAFFDERKAMDFVASCPLPIVAKLRHGSGSYNVRLLKTRHQARAYVRRMFGRGATPIPALLADARHKFRAAASAGGIHGVLRRLKKAPNFFREVLRGRKYFPTEKGYVLFQKFLAGNTYDVRVTVAGDRAWAFRRMVRHGDFRASGSGVVDYDTTQFPSNLVARSFVAADRIGMPSISLDWVRGDDEFYFVEVSLGTCDKTTYGCNGHWDRDMKWHEGHQYPSIGVVEDFLKRKQEGQQRRERAMRCWSCRGERVGGRVRDCGTCLP